MDDPFDYFGKGDPFDYFGKGDPFDYSDIGDSFYSLCIGDSSNEEGSHNKAPDKELNSHTPDQVPDSRASDKVSRISYEDPHSCRAKSSALGKGKNENLTFEGKEFKEQFYNLFLNDRDYKNKFDKKYVISIYNYIIKKDQKMQPMTRNEKRSINLFFNWRVKDSTKILDLIKTYKAEIIEEVVGFQQYLNSFDARHNRKKLI